MATDKRLDRFFRHKLEGRSFEFDNRHWLAAQSLIEQQERRRRFIFWWLLFGLLFLGLLIPAAYWWLEKQPGQPIQHLPKEHPILRPFPRQDTAPYALLETSPRKASPSKSKTSAELPTARLFNGQTVLSRKTALKPNPLSPPADKITGPAIAAGSSSPEQLLGVESAPVGPVLEAASPVLPSTPAAVVAYAGGSLLDSQTLHRPVFRPSLHQEIRLGASWRPEWDEAGFSAGLGFNWRFHRSWGLQLGLAYHRKPDEAQPIGQTVEYNFGFGLSETRYTLRPQSLHLLEAPVNVFWQSGRHRVEFGASPSYLLGAHGDLALDTLGEPGGFRALKTGWLSTEGLRNWQVSLGAAYRFYFDTRWALGGRFEYALLREPVRPKDIRYTGHLQLIYLLP